MRDYPPLRDGNVAEEPSCEVCVARTIGEVEAMRGTWSAWNTHRDSDIDFCTAFVWKARNFIRPHVISIYRDGVPDAILVGRLENAPIELRIGYLRLLSVPTRVLSFSLDGFLGQQTEQNSEELVKFLMESLQRGEADAAFFHLKTESPLFDKAITLPGPVCRDHFVQRFDYRVMRISGLVEEVYAGFSSGLRAEVRRKRRKVFKDFGDGVETRCVRSVEDLEDFILRAEEVARKTYQRGLGVGFEDTELTRRDLRVCAERGWLRAYLLTIDGRPRAFWIGTCYEGVFYSGDIGYDPEMADYSLGIFLFSEMIEDFCQSGVKEIHFGVGSGEFKERFGSLNSEVAWFFIFGPTWKARLLNTARTAALLIDLGAKRVLHKMGVLAAVKRMWRSRLSLAVRRGRQQ